MNNKGEASNPMVILIWAVVGILLLMAFIGIVADTKSQQTGLLSIADEQSNLHTLSCYTGIGEINESNSACNITVNTWYATDDWRLSESQCYLSSVVVSNDTGVALTEDTDYKIFASSGIIQLLNTTTMANTSATMNDNLLEVDYNYCGSGYLTSSGDRGIADLWTTIMIIALIIFLVLTVKKLWGED